MTNHNSNFTRPLLMRITEHGAGFVELLATRAEHDPALASHMLAALDHLYRAFPDLAVEGIAKPMAARK